LDAVEQRFADRPGLAFRMAPARLGRRLYSAAVEFWEEIAAQPPAHP
jgi:hypothetical protein